MNTLITLAWRNLWRNKRRTFITTSSVMFAVVLATALLAMARGLKDTMIDSLVRFNTGHLQIQDVMYHDEPVIDHSFYWDKDLHEKLMSLSELIDYGIPRLSGFSLAATGQNTRGAVVQGIDLAMENRMNRLEDKLVQGRFFENDEQAVVLARGLAEQLGLTIGDTLILLGQGFQGATATGQYPVVGMARFSIPELDNTLVYMPLNEAQWFFNAPDMLSSLVIMIKDEERTHEAAAAVQSLLDPEWYAVRTWDELLPDMVGLIELRESVNRIMGLILYVVVGFGIFGTILNMLFERFREFGILLSIGLKRGQLAIICLLESLFISALGAVSGILTALPIMAWFHLRPLEFKGGLAEYMLDLGLEPFIPFSIAPDVFLTQAMTVFFIAFIIGLYPIRKVFRLDMIAASRS